MTSRPVTIESDGAGWLARCARGCPAVRRLPHHRIAWLAALDEFVTHACTGPAGRGTSEPHARAVERALLWVAASLCAIAIVHALVNGWPAPARVPWGVP